MNAKEQLAALAKSAKEFKEAADSEIESLRQTVASLRRKNEALQKYACGSSKCDKRQKLHFCECGRIIKV